MLYALIAENSALVALLAYGWYLNRKDRKWREAQHYFDSVDAMSTDEVAPAQPFGFC